MKRIVPPPQKVSPSAKSAGREHVLLGKGAGTDLGGALANWAQRSVSAAPRVQAKLEIGAPHDAFEQEADEFAAAATNGLEASGFGMIEGGMAAAGAEVVQPKLQEPAMEEEAAVEETRTLRPKLHFSGSSGGGTDAPPNLPEDIGNLRGKGSGLPAHLRGHYERLLGSRLGGVRIHSGAESATLNRQIGARAFTLGQDIFFGQGQYNDASRAGQELIAHEVAHTVQQGNGEVVRRRVDPSTAEENFLDPKELSQELEELLNQAELDAIDSLRHANPRHATHFRYYALLADYALKQRFVHYDIGKIDAELYRDLEDLAELARNERDTLARLPSAPEEEDFSKGFPEYWSNQIKTHIYYNNLSEMRRIRRDRASAHESMKRISKVFPSEFATNGYPIGPKKIKSIDPHSKFQPSWIDQSMAGASPIQEFIRQNEDYIFNKKRELYFDNWNSNAERYQQMQLHQNLEYLVPNPDQESLEMSLQTVAYFIEYTQSLVHLFAISNQRRRDFLPLTLEMLEGNIAWTLKDWDKKRPKEGDELLAAAVAKADKMILKMKGDNRLGRAFEWAWRYGYFGAAFQDMLTAFKDNAVEIILQTLAVVGGVAVAQFVPGLNVAVDILLILVGGLDALDTIASLVTAITAASNSKSVIALQTNASKIATTLTSDVVGLLIDLAMMLFGAANKRPSKKKHENTDNIEDWVNRIKDEGTSEQKAIIERAERNGTLKKASEAEKEVAERTGTKLPKTTGKKGTSPFAAKTINTIEELRLETSANRPVGNFIAEKAEAWDIVNRLARNDPSGLEKLGIRLKGQSFDASAVEWGLARDKKTGEYFIIKGAEASPGLDGAVDWNDYIGKVDMIAHTHPYYGFGGKKRSLQLEGKGQPLAKMLRVSHNQTMLLPSAEDILLMARKGVDGHRVITPYRYDPVGKVVMNPENAMHLPVIEIEISKPKFIGKGEIFEKDAFQARLRLRAGGKLIEGGKIDLFVLDSPHGPLISRERPMVKTHAADSGPPATSSKAALDLKLQLAVRELANDAVDSLIATGRLPGSYVTKAEARAAGWEEGKSLQRFLPGKQIGGDRFEDRKRKLPTADGREWYEADIGIDYAMKRSNQPGTRLLYSNDGLIYMTWDHYETMEFVGKYKF